MPTNDFRNNRKNNKVALSEYAMMPPHDKVLEEAVLGAILIDEGGYDRICNLLTPECFYEREHQQIFTAFRELASAKRPIDYITVVEMMKSLGTLEEVGGAAKIVGLTEGVNSSSHLEVHAQQVYEKYLGRQIITFCSEAERDVFLQQEPVKEVLTRVESGIFDLTVNSTRTDFRDMKSMLMETMKEIEHASNQHGMSGIPSGFSVLDHNTSGWQPSDLIIVAARPAMGKTAFILSMAKNIIDQDIPVGIFSLEMSTSQLMKRVISNSTNIPARDILNGNLNPIDFQVLNAQISKLQDKPLYIDDSGALSILDLCSKARRQVKEHGIKILFIDYLQLVHADGRTINNREQEVSTISRTLKQLAKELNIPIVALSQLNRGVEGRTGENKRPMLSDLRESGAIEQDADMVVMIHRPEYYGILEDEHGNSTIGKAEIIIAKNRNGATGIINLQFKANIIKFCELETNAPTGFALPFVNSDPVVSNDTDNADEISGKDKAVGNDKDLDTETSPFDFNNDEVGDKF